MTKRIRKKIFIGIGVFYIAFTGGGGCNVFTDMANRTSDQAILDDANNLVDHQFYNDAILKLNTLSAAGQVRRDARILFASAYAGRGGLDLINLSLTLSGTGNPPTFFLTLLKAFAGKTLSHYNDQIVAESYIMAIAPAAANRTADENMFVMFVEMAKLGAMFAVRADPLGLGTVNASFNSACTGITTADSDQVVTAIGIIVDSMGAIGNNAMTGQLSPIIAQCGLLGGLCGVTQTSGVTPLMERAAKTLVGENNLNIGLQVTATKNICELSSGGACSGTFPINFCP